MGKKTVEKVSKEKGSGETTGDVNSKPSPPESNGVKAEPILSPNTHIALTAALTAILLCVALYPRFLIQDKSTLDLTSLELLQKECDQNGQNIIPCIKNILKHKTPAQNAAENSWISVLEQVYEQSRNILGPLTTLKSFHQDKLLFVVKDFSTNMARVTKELEGLSSWKENVDSDLKSLVATSQDTKQRMEDFEKEKEALERRVETFSDTMKTFSSSSLKGDLDALKDNMSSLTSKFTQFTNQRNELNNLYKVLDERLTSEIKTIKDDIVLGNDKFDAFTKSTEESKKQMDRRLSDHENSITTIHEEMLPGVKTEIHNVHSDLIVFKKDADQRFLGVDQEVSDVRMKSKEAKDFADQNAKNLEDHKTVANTRHDALEAYKKEMQSKYVDSSIKHSVSEELIDEIRNNLKFRDIGTYLMLIVIAFGAYFGMQLLRRGGTEDRSSEKWTIGKQNIHPENNDIYKLKWDRPMENSVCVVTYHSETERQHYSKTKSMFESFGDTPPTIHSRLIRRHADIQDLPGSRIFLVFIDFNERNVILEDPAKGLGDLRISTVRSLWRFGADVTVIYCGDKGSKTLDNELFNRNLSSIYSHAELSQLKNQQRMLSIFAEFSDAQKQHCRNFINKQLKRA